MALNPCTQMRDFLHDQLFHELYTHHASKGLIYMLIKANTMTRHVFRTRLSPRFGRAPSTCPCAVKVVATPP